MKRLIILMCMLSLAFCLSACQSFTVNDAIAAFDDETYYAQAYSEDLIDPIRQKMALSGDIISIVHIINQGASTPNGDFAYIYEFSNEKDATWFEENRSAYVSSLEEGRCVRFGSIVIFGTSSVIDTLSE